MRATLVILAILAAAAPRARAEPDAAEAAYQEGRRLYDLREWDRAIDKFKEAYAARPEARSLFNIAQAYRLAGDCAQAVSFYQTYERNFPTAPNLDKVEKFLRDLQPCPARPSPQPAAPEPAAPAPAPIPTVATPAPAPIRAPAPAPTIAPPPRGRGERIAGLTLGAVGLVALAAGGYFAYQSSQRSSDAEHGTGAWDPQLQSDGRAANLRAEIAFGVGGGALIAGGVLYYLGHRAAERPAVSVVPHRDGGIVVWSGGF